MQNQIVRWKGDILFWRIRGLLLLNIQGGKDEDSASDYRTEFPVEFSTVLTLLVVPIYQTTQQWAGDGVNVNDVHNTYFLHHSYGRNWGIYPCAKYWIAVGS